MIRMMKSLQLREPVGEPFGALVSGVPLGVDPGALRSARAFEGPAELEASGGLLNSINP